MVPESNLSESDDDLDLESNGDGGARPAPSDEDESMQVDETAAAAPGKKLPSLNPEQVLSFVRRLAREGPRKLTAAESELSKCIIALRKRWLGRVHDKQSLLKTRRRAVVAGVVPFTATLDDGEAKPRKRRMPSRTLPEYDAGTESVYKGSVLEILPQRKKVDALLQSVAAFFHQPNKNGVPPGMERYIMPAEDRLHYSTLDALLSPLRKQTVWESWSPIQLALFEAGIYTLGKNFHEISKLIDNKTTGDIVNLYYHWKQTSHYNMWKTMGKPITSQQPSLPSPNGKRNAGPTASLARQPKQDGPDI